MLCVGRPPKNFSECSSIILFRLVSDNFAESKSISCTNISENACASRRYYIKMTNTNSFRYHVLNTTAWIQEKNNGKFQKHHSTTSIEKFSVYDLFIHLATKVHIYRLGCIAISVSRSYIVATHNL